MKKTLLCRGDPEPIAWTEGQERVLSVRPEALKLLELSRKSTLCIDLGKGFLKSIGNDPQESKVGLRENKSW